MKRNQIPLFCLFLASMNLASVYAETSIQRSSGQICPEYARLTENNPLKAVTQNKHLQPTPQQVVYSEQTIDIPKNYQLNVTGISRLGDDVPGDRTLEINVTVRNWEKMDEETVDMVETETN